MRLFVWIPIKNEGAILRSSLEKLIQEIKASFWRDIYKITVIDNKSTDKSFEILSSLPIEKLQTTNSKLSIWESIQFARAHARKSDHSLNELDIDLIYPIDGDLKKAALDELFYKATYSRQTSDLLYGGFDKQYDSSNNKQSLWFRLYSGFQNAFLFRLSRQLLWTHYPFATSRLFDQIQAPKGGFLEDLQISDQLKMLSKQDSSICFLPLKGPAMVSSRRYQNSKRGALSQVMINARIWLLYRLGLRSYKKLRSIYDMDSKL